jgi:hypothetical protein
MNKTKRYAAIICVVVNLLGVGLTTKVIWGYYQDWDPSGPAQQKLVGMDETAYFKFRQKHNEPLLKILHYGLLPVLSGCMILSAGAVLWLARKVT